MCNESSGVQSATNDDIRDHLSPPEQQSFDADPDRMIESTLEQKLIMKGLQEQSIVRRSMFGMVSCTERMLNEKVIELEAWHTIASRARN